MSTKFGQNPSWHYDSAFNRPTATDSTIRRLLERSEQLGMISKPRVRCWRELSIDLKDFVAIYGDLLTPSELRLVFEFYSAKEMA